MWVEKYRPRSLDEMINQEEIVSRLRRFVEERNLPHLLFVGPAGVGKTTAILALAHDLYGPQYRNHIMELNASVAPETPILIRRGGAISRTNFKELEKEYFKDDSYTYVKVDSLEILSIDRSYNVRFMPVSIISRHKIDKLVNIKYEGGRIRTSPSHSIIVMDENGNLIPKRAIELREGDLLITFGSELMGEEIKLKFGEFMPKVYSVLVSGRVRNPKVKKIFGDMLLDEGLSWLFGLYLAEGCVNFKAGTSGQLIFSLGYPEEVEVARKIVDTIKDRFELSARLELNSSGFARDEISSIQVRVFNTQLAKFFAEHFYDDPERRDASTKRVPSFIFRATTPNRLSFLRGYMGDSYGSWGRYVRYSSKSLENLIDVAWLGRISELDTSCFEKESRIIWKLESYSYIKTQFIPAMPVIRFLKRIKDKIDFPYTCALRHQLYGRRARRISKEIVRTLLDKVNIEKLSLGERGIFENLSRFLNSPLSVVKIRKIDLENYDGYVYDVSVPDMEMFWGGFTPILLHNSDERGINVIREKVKFFARTAPIGDVPFKILIMDEADSLTADAQHALRRTMERYTRTCRFCLIGNYSERIIEPVQSRCSIFRFSPLSEEDVKRCLRMIAEKEGVHVSPEGYDALYKESRGDLRKAINLLQAAAAASGRRVDAEVVYAVLGRVSPRRVREMIQLSLKGEFIEAREVLRSLLIDEGMAAEDVLKMIYSEILRINIPERWKVRLSDIVGEVDYRLTQGSRPEIQLSALLAKLALAGEEMRGG